MPYTLAHTWANTKSSKKWDFEKKNKTFFSWAGCRAGLPRKSRVVNWDSLFPLASTGLF